MSGRITDASPEMRAANVIPLPAGELPRQLAAARRDYETLRQSIETMQQCLRRLESVRESVHGPPHKALQGRMICLNELLVLWLDQLSRTDRLLRELLRRQ